MSEKLTVGSCFSGIGGLELGLEWTGQFETKWQIENDPYASAVLAKHWPSVRRYNDITTVGGGHLEPVDVICGGFPCQDVSLAGARAGLGGKRSTLWSEMFRLICEVKPRWVVAENVPGLLSSDDGRFFGNILRDLASAGYNAEWGVLSAAGVGAPHLRQRVFILGHPSSVGGRGGKQSESEREEAPPGSPEIVPWIGSKQNGKQSGSSDQSWWTVEPNVRGMADGISTGLDGDLNEERMDSMESSVGLSEVGMRTLWRNYTNRPPSQRRQSLQQFAREFANTLPKMPHEISLANGQEGLEAVATFLRRVRQAFAEIGLVCDTPKQIAEAWESISDEEKERVFLASYGRAHWPSGEWYGATRVAKGVEKRVDRLRCLGNAVVPQVAQKVGEMILKCEQGSNS